MFSYAAREFRHNPCLMGPLTFIGGLIVSVFWLVALVWKCPIFMLGFLLSPLLNRSQFIIEFFYPLGLGRMIHLSLTRMMQNASVKGSKSSDKNRGFHSRSVETRIEVIPDRLYVHPLPQFLDNLGYLVVCLPNEQLVTLLVESTPMGNNGPSTITSQPQVSHDPIVAFIVDCGDAVTILEQINIISEIHYQSKPILVQSILSTHKHHDHTAGNLAFRRATNANRNVDLKTIVGGAVENIPGCNYRVADGDLVPLPFFGSNNMGDCVEVEAVATPAHTRGSITYVCRVKPEHRSEASLLGLLFTGDTIFSAGGGVPFEADVDPGQEQQEPKKAFTSIIKASASFYAIERCFGQILARSLNTQSFTENMADKMFIMPGHEYTQDLLSRQLANGNSTSNCWKNLTPHVFFETASQLYVALHRRSLPHSSGKLITAMASPVSLELCINPYFRNMKRRGGIILQAINFWHTHFARDKIPSRLPSLYHTPSANGQSSSFKESSRIDNQTQSRRVSHENQWTLTVNDLTQPVFTTVYSANLDQIIRDLDQGNLSPQEGAKRLTEMKEQLKHGLISRRPVPSSLPSDRAVYRGLLALALLGSSPCALTVSDSHRMNLPKPVVRSSDHILVSRSHLISVLQWLGLLGDENNGRQTIAMIHQLWKEALEDSPTCRQMKKTPNYDTIEPENGPPDLVELGDLKWQLYGVPRRQSTMSYCLPCSKPKRIDPTHPANGSGMLPHSGEIVRHDIMACPICRTRAGCPHLSVDDNAEEEQLSVEISKSSSSSSPENFENGNSDNNGLYVEVQSALHEV